MSVIRAVADEIAVLDGGRPIEQGRAGDVIVAVLIILVCGVQWGGDRLARALTV